MKGQTFTLAQTQQEFVWLELDSEPSPSRFAIFLPRAFQLADAREALLLSGQVSASDERFTLTSDLAWDELCQLVEEMLGYFRAPGEVSEQLTAVVAAVNEYEPALRTAAVPLLAYAWLDITVRDDLADQARSARDIWQKHTLEIDCQTACDRRVAELLARFTALPSRLAPSIATRAQRQAGDQHAG